jgi:hypothetical protein
MSRQTTTPSRNPGFEIRLISEQATGLREVIEHEMLVPIF